MKKRFGRRTFIEKLSKTSLLTGLMTTPVAVFAEQPGDDREIAKAAGEHSFLTLPYLQNHSPTSVTVMWITNKDSYSWVEFGEAVELGKKADAVTDGLTNANNTLHKIKLDGLKPATSYRYKVCSREINEFKPYKLTYGDTIETEVFTFKTPDSDAKEVSWLVLNDIHDRPASIPHLMSFKGEKEYDFVFLNGDMFDYQTDRQQMIDHLLQPCATNFASGIPYLYTRGNHETRGKYARQHPNYFDCPGGKYYFSFTQGPVHFVVLDTGEDKPDNDPAYSGLVSFDRYREEQASWLEQEIKTKAFKNAPFRVVMMHIPVFYSGDWHGPMHCRQLFNPLFNKGAIDLFIAGHTHKYGTYEANAETHHYRIVIGGGPLEGKRTLIKVNATQKLLTLDMVKDDGSLVGNFKIKSKK
jgi:predicted phosphodiesterase